MQLNETEDGFTAAVLQLAKLRGWRSAHFRPARTATGWRTAVAGDGKGFPDVVLIRNGALVVAELKTERGETSPEQDDWLEAFQAAGIEATVWRPSDWESIKKRLE